MTLLLNNTLLSLVRNNFAMECSNKEGHLGFLIKNNRFQDMKRARIMTPCKPIKMWIDGKSFEVRKFEKHKRTAFEKAQESTAGKFEMSTDSDGNFCTSFRIPALYYQRLIRFPDFDLKALEDDTATFIKLSLNGNSTIKGKNEDAVAYVRDEIHSMIGEIRNQSPAMQFIAIPTRSDEIANNFIKFKESLLNGAKIQGMEETIFQKPEKLHLTICVFTLLDEAEKSEAVKALTEYKERRLPALISTVKPLRIQISGINHMESNMEKVNVLYANATLISYNEDLTLQKIANDLSDYFYDRGLVVRYQENVKLHMTLINTKYRKTMESPKKRWIKRQTIDATAIMESYQDYYFGECELNSVHLCLMSSLGDDGFYQSIAAINI